LQAAFSGHHKRFHIERDEFNDFSRYMFAFDEVPAYKDYLSEMLNKKGFFENQSFKMLFDKGTSLNDLYVKTKKTYETWMGKQSTREQDAEKYTLPNYQKIFDDQMFYINLSHFITYLETKSKLDSDGQHIKFKALENSQYLIGQYYYAQKLEKNEYKTCRKLYNKLNATRLEDALLYEMTMRYLKIDPQIAQKAKTQLTNILTQDIEFEVTKAETLLYKLIVPFNKIDSFVELKNRQNDDEKYHKGASFMANIDNYINMIWNEIPWHEKRNNAKKVTHATMYPITEKYSKQKTITYDDLQKIHQHLLTSSNKLTRVSMEIERFYLCKPNEKGKVIFDGEIDDKTGCYLVRFENTGVLKSYFGEGRNSIRNKAFHFLIPSQKSYESELNKIEKLFITNEIKPLHLSGYNDLSYALKTVCTVFLEIQHNSFFRIEKDGIKKRRDAENRYFTELILK
ncbi:MAG: hypothetical protein PF541_05845, partial [Prolixibacteraceae bacterium]|nr:hypothetical protein [Prolixibacteraceae bacterium]